MKNNLNFNILTETAFIFTSISMSKQGFTQYTVKLRQFVTRKFDTSQQINKNYIYMSQLS